MTADRIKRELKKKQPFVSDEQEAVLNILRTGDQFQNRFGRLFRPYGITSSQYNVLRILRGAGQPMPSLEIGARMIQVVPAMTGLIDRLPKIDCVQSAASAAICQTIRRLRAGNIAAVDWSTVKVDQVKATTVADSISVDQPRDGLAAVKATVLSGGEAITVADGEILAAIPEMAQSTGIFPEPAAAAPWAAVKQMVREEKIRPNELVVCFVSGSGLKDIARASSVAGSPQVIDPSIDAVRSALAHDKAAHN